MRTCKFHPARDLAVVPETSCWHCWRLWSWRVRQSKIHEPGKDTAPKVKKAA